MELKYGSSLQQGRYIIEKVLGQGGFGITYLACQTGLNRKVAVKEFFMQEYCNRDAGTSRVSVPSMGSRELVERYRQKFLKEARLIASFDNNNIIRIYDVFEDNGTAYYVMEYLEGKNLKAVLEECGPLPEDLALKYIRQISLALAEVHASNLLHLDVKPANIMLNKKGEAVLIDFGISKHYDEGGKQTSSALAGTSEGYAPLEQYEAGALDSFTPATDIYALGATLFCLLAGMRPPKASEVMNHGLPELPQDISPAVREAVTAAMQPMVRMRPQSVEEFLELLNSKDLRDPKAFKDLSEETKAPEEELIDDVDVEVTVLPENREQSIENRVQSAKAKTIEVENEETLAVEKKIEQPTIKNNEPIAPKNNRTALVAATVVLLSGVIGYFLAQGGYDDSKSPRKETLQETADGVAEPDAPTLQSIANGVSASALQGAIANPADGEIPVEGHSADKPVKPNEQGAGQGGQPQNSTTSALTNYLNGDRTQASEIMEQQNAQDRKEENSVNTTNNANATNRVDETGTIRTATGGTGVVGENGVSTTGAGGN